MIFYNSIHDEKPVNTGLTVKYLFSNSEDIDVEYIKKGLTFEEYLSYFVPYNLRNLEEEHIWQFSKLFQFGNAIVN